MAARSRGDLTRDDIVGAALALLDQGGSPACTVRQVAARLQVTPMAIYWHVRDKRALLDAVLDRVLATALAPQPGKELPVDPWDQLAEMGRRYRAAFVGHPNAAALLATRPMPEGAAAGELLAAVVSVLSSVGLTGQELTCAAMLLQEFAMGSVLLEHGLRPAEVIGIVGGDRTHPDAGTRFEYGMRVLLAGIRADAASRGEPGRVGLGSDR